MPVQPNTFDCGVYTIGFVESFLNEVKKEKVEKVDEWKIDGKGF